jgi:hypothetical protein
VNEGDIMRQTGHKSPAMLAKYIRVGQMFMHNVASGLCHLIHMLNSEKKASRTLTLPRPEALPGLEVMFLLLHLPLSQNI